MLALRCHKRDACGSGGILFDDKHVKAAWFSPSGLGIKVLFKTESTKETHKIYFSEICDYILNNYNLQPDKSGSDTCRICFTSYDPDILIKENCVPFSVDVSDVIHKTANVIKKTSVSYPVNDDTFYKKLFHSPEGRNGKSDRDNIDKIIKYLRGRSLSITSNYQDWVRVGLAIANSFTFELGKKYYLRLCELDGKQHDEYKSLNLLDYCYRNRILGSVNFATIIYLAEQKGFKTIKKTKSNITPTMQR